MPLLSAADLYTKLKQNKHGVYAGCPKIEEDTEYFYCGQHGGILVYKGTERNAEEYTLSGIFEVDHCNCYLAPDGSFDPNNAFGQTFTDTKLNCQLQPVQCDLDFSFSAQDWLTLVQHIQKLEDMAPLEQGEDRMNVLHVVQTSDLDGGNIKIIHPLFEIPPEDYLEKIPGAIVQVHFTIQHCFIQRGKQEMLMMFGLNQLNNRSEDHSTCTTSWKYSQEMPSSLVIEQQWNHSGYYHVNWNKREWNLKNSMKENMAESGVLFIVEAHKDGGINLFYVRNLNIMDAQDIIVTLLPLQLFLFEEPEISRSQ
ncbi:hypothetical protein J3A83DRAFT_4195719 [Scleroderma citrinum]